ncbi:hypothetical protein ACWD25_60675, partial [Streptomyces sp. NPDC002920]
MAVPPAPSAPSAAPSAPAPSSASPADEPEPSGRGSRSGLMTLCAVALLILAVGLAGGRDPSSPSPGGS